MKQQRHSNALVCIYFSFNDLRLCGDSNFTMVTIIISSCPPFSSFVLLSLRWIKFLSRGVGGGRGTGSDYTYLTWCVFTFRADSFHERRRIFQDHLFSFLLSFPPPLSCFLHQPPSDPIITQFVRGNLGLIKFYPSSLYLHSSSCHSSVPSLPFYWLAATKLLCICFQSYVLFFFADF